LVKKKSIKNLFAPLPFFISKPIHLVATSIVSDIVGSAHPPKDVFPLSYFSFGGASTALIIGLVLLNNETGQQIARFIGAVLAGAVSTVDLRVCGSPICSTAIL
jgi:hypothetical protein